MHLLDISYTSHQAPHPFEGKGVHSYSESRFSLSKWSKHCSQYWKVLVVGHLVLLHQCGLFSKGKKSEYVSCWLVALTETEKRNAWVRYRLLSSPTRVQMPKQKHSTESLNDEVKLLIITTQKKSRLLELRASVVLKISTVVHFINIGFVFFWSFGRDKRYNGLKTTTTFPPRTSTVDAISARYISRLAKATTRLKIIPQRIQFFFHASIYEEWTRVSYARHGQ